MRWVSGSVFSIMAAAAVDYRQDEPSDSLRGGRNAHEWDSG